jgi:long-subunit acyl-CoA synthetase (AMP-forming)
MTNLTLNCTFVNIVRNFNLDDKGNPSPGVSVMMNDVDEATLRAELVARGWKPPEEAKP